MLLKLSLDLSILLQLSTAALIPRQLDHAGEFAIVNCGVQNGGLVHTLLDELPGVLLPAAQDAESTQGAAFQAFFKSAEQGASVSNILAKIAQGASVFPADQFTNGAPGFMCIHGKGQVVGKTRQTGEPIDFFDTCGEFTAAAYFPGTKWIILCPGFFTAPTLIDSPPAPPADNRPAPNCLRTSRRGIQFDGTRDDRHGATHLVQYKVWVLLEELAHAYISVAEGDEKEPSDIYDANAMFFLSVEESVRNAASYVIYVASLYGKCTEFPISTGRELLSAADDLAEWQTAREINPAAVVKIPVQDVVVNVPSTVPEERIST